MKNIKKIAITGGPCGGKTRAIEWLRRSYTDTQYAVLFISETATDLINGGLNHESCGSSKAFQEAILKLQIEKEKVYLNAAVDMQEDDILIICDRGVMDGKAYISDEEFMEICMEAGVTEDELLAHYDAVFHLTSAAKGAQDHYSFKNAARRESSEQAALLDDITLNCWKDHPYLRVIGNTEVFEDKMKLLGSEITMFLNDMQA